MNEKPQNKGKKDGFLTLLMFLHEKCATIVTIYN
jgi:hypothetical protein